MKTPREVLLEHHQAAVPRLDALRREVLGGGALVAAAPRPTTPGWFALAWRELIWPCRGIWAGLAAVWILLLAANLSWTDRPTAIARRAPEPSAEVLLAFWRQERSLAELIEPHPPRLAVPAKAALPRPRSQGSTEFFYI